MCGDCVRIPGGFAIRNKGGLRFLGRTFDDNKMGKGSIQVQNVCLLAKYGNGGQYGSRGMPSGQSMAVGGGPRGPHWFGNCNPSDPCAKCSNSKIMDQGADFGAFAHGNKCAGDHDLDGAWTEVQCYFPSGDGNAKPSWWGGHWGECIAPSSTCTALGITDNLCGACTKIPGGFLLSNSGAIRFNGYSFDDNKNARGNIQPINVCLLAKYGNKGDYPAAGSKEMPSRRSRAVMGRKGLKGPHYFANCMPGGCDKCANAKLLTKGQDFSEFAIGNKCTSKLI